MKTIFKNLKNELGLGGLTFIQAAIMFWSALAFCLMLCCDYENSSWYAMPVLVGHFILSAYVAYRYIPKSFWRTDEK